MTNDPLDSPLNSSLGAQLRTLRLERDLTQEQLAEQLGMSPRYVAGVERGEYNLSLASIEALADQLGVAPRLVLDGVTDSAK